MVKIPEELLEKRLNFSQADTRLILNSRVNNEAAGIVTKVVDGILLLIYALSQLEWFLPSLYRQQ